jgi:CRP/FNR family transcriptional regulator, cyclic AMP receptor protein
MNKNVLLQSVPLFKGLSSKDLDFLAYSVQVHRYRSGEVIFNQGDEGDTMYIVVLGCVNIFVVDSTSQSISLQDLTRGEYFGELALIDDKPRSAGAIASTNVELLELTREMLSNYIHAEPRVAMTILQTMSSRLRETNLLLSQRAAVNVDEEIDRNLSWSDRLADRVAELNGSWMFIIFLGGITLLWMGVNSPAILGNAFDPYPYVFFNLLLAIIVALQGPLIVMSQNRKAIRDRFLSEADYKVNLKNEVNIEMILHQVQSITSHLQLLEAEVNNSQS